MAYSAKIVLDSVSQIGVRLTTMEVTFPRMVLSEFNTHRAFSRNSASSRAIPVDKQLARIRTDPFIPIYWGKQQAGMQAEHELDDYGRDIATRVWLDARDMAVDQAEKLKYMGLHKQITNRLLEPFMWHTVIVTATEWSNFFALRANADAQPEIRVIAEMMQDIYRDSTPQLVKLDEWHMPLIQPDEAEWARNNSKVARRVSAARCARVSYLTHDGKRDIDKDLELYDRLVRSGHMSPLEHVATPTGVSIVMDHAGQEYTRPSDHNEFHGNFRDWFQLRKSITYESDFSRRPRG